MQKFLKKRGVIVFSLVNGSLPDPDDFTKTVEDTDCSKYEVLPDGTRHGSFFWKNGYSEESCTYKFGALHGEHWRVYDSPEVYIKTTASFRNGKLHGEFREGNSVLEYDNGELLRHICGDDLCPFFCSIEGKRGEIKWERQGNDLVVTQKTLEENVVVIKYSDVSFGCWDGSRWGAVGIFVQPRPDAKIMVAKYWAVTQGRLFDMTGGKMNEGGNARVPYFSY
ncbi:hypothetical protein LAU_0254 [Lausannevirus]|uniref:MORN repeat-containing protein n=2 Tax=Lausannevirus TaxID=999883 RepID=A0A0N9PZ39_9VIRU|nr:hypothetical protein LAU_0254 [Lausannevirus]AEA07105.1 hypothetical protein LAU_0254 [Lausannevirus]ALH06926.1 hypothetical protein PMV_228 [Port-miou virus]